jgi:hypothetical protein
VSAVTPRLWEDDESLLAELGEALRGPRATSAAFAEAGRLAFAWRTIDEELALAALAYDSALDQELLLRAGARSSARVLVFDGPAMSVAIEVSGDEVAGHLSPPQAGRISVLTVRGPVGEVAADREGGFLFARPTGPVRLRCRTEAASMVTDWVRL